MEQKNKNIFSLFLIVALLAIFSLFIGISIRKNVIIKEETKKETIETTKTMKQQVNKNIIIDYETDTVSITKENDKTINNIKTKLYNVNLSSIGLNFIVPQIALKEEFNKVNGFNEIKITKEKDFDNNYIMFNETSFSSLIPNTYFILAREIELNEEQLNLKNNEIINSIFKNSFVTIEDEIETKTINSVKVLKYNIKMNPFGDIENSNNYDGKLIVYISNNTAKILICGVSTFSYESEAKLSLCEYVIESSTAIF